MAGVSQEFIQELLDKNNVIDVIGRYCTLQRKGATNHWACCPLPGHTEKTPSFAVNEVGQFYHCFGCGKSGNVIKFIQEVESLDFIEAVSFLAEQSGMDVSAISGYNDKESRERYAKIKKLEALMKDTAIFYVNNFASPRAKPYIEYVKSRGLTASTLKKYGIGVSLDYNSLPKYLEEKGYTKLEMVEAGVCANNSNGVYDFEAERLIVPIIDQKGKVIAFGGRTLEKDPDFAKYKNTQETILFNKRKVLFGLNNLKQLKNSEDFGRVIMVEGYMDVISLSQAGVQNAVASMGTSLTVEQAKLLKRYTDKVVVSYDGDGAGQKATVRSLNIFEEEGFDVRVATLPNGLDPDDVIKKYGVDGYNKILDEALPLADYKLSLLVKGKDMNDLGDKRKFVTQALTYLRTISQASLREELLIKVRDISGRSYESLKRDLESGEMAKSNEQKLAVTVEINQGSGTERAERFILASLIYKKPYANGYDFSLSFTSDIREKIADALTYEDVTPQNIYEIVGENGAEELTVILTAGESVFNTANEERYYADCVRAVKKANIQREIDELNKLYKAESDLTARAEIANLIQIKNLNLRKIK